MSKHYRTFDGGLPFASDDLQFVNQATNEQALALAKGMVAAGTTAQVLHGCAITGTDTSTSIAAGWLYWNVPGVGELVLRVAAGTVNQTGAANVRLRLVSAATVMGYAQTVVFKNTTPRQIYAEDYVELVATNDTGVNDKLLLIAPVVGQSLAVLQPSALAYVCKGDWKSWTMPDGDTLDMYFNANGEGVHPKMVGWCIARGQMIGGRQMPPAAGRVLVGAGTLQYAPGFNGQTYEQGQIFGFETVQLHIQHMPRHRHGEGSNVPDGEIGPDELGVLRQSAPGSNTTPSVDSTGSGTEPNVLRAHRIPLQGGDVPHENRQPSLVTYHLYRYL